MSIKHCTAYFFLLIACLVLKAPAETSPVITVNTTEELIKSIGSNRTIVLKKRHYNITHATAVRNRYVKWEKSLYDEKVSEPVIVNVKNLVLKGARGCAVLNDNSSANILQFRNSSNITIDNIILGHSAMEEFCGGGVLGFRNCSNISVDECLLYGTGHMGLKLNRVKNLRMSNSSVSDCTVKLMEINYSENISFENTLFERTEYWRLIDISNSTGVSFNHCLFSCNRAESKSMQPYLFSCGENNSGLSLTGSIFAANRVLYLSNSKVIKMSGNLYAGNLFDRNNPSETTKRIKGFSKGSYVKIREKPSVSGRALARLEKDEEFEIMETCKNTEKTAIVAYAHSVNVGGKAVSFSPGRIVKMKNSWQSKGKSLGIKKVEVLISFNGKTFNVVIPKMKLASIGGFVKIKTSSGKSGWVALNYVRLNRF